MDAKSTESLTARCCIVGGGPAGMMLGFLLARAGIDVCVLEKHADFFRDFRGDTIHPSTLELFHELGMLEAFLALPHKEAVRLAGWVGDEKIIVADLSHLPTRCKFIAFMPQWDFLDFVACEARRYENFGLRMNVEAVDLVFEDDRVAGVLAKTPEGVLEVRADLVVAADGRHSALRGRAELEVIDLGAPMDVLWLKLARRQSDPEQSFGRFEPGRVMVLIDRGDYWQCGFVIRKGGFEEMKSSGLDAFRSEIAERAPIFADRVGEIADWEQVRLLTVAVDRLKRWQRDGLLCIGDSAHAMSPIGGVGINLAIQDAVATANLLAEPLRRGAPTLAELDAVQKRREPPARLTQAVQLFIQNRIITGVLAGRPFKALPLPLRLLRDFPILRRVPARFIGLGLRPEHVRTALVTVGNERCARDETGQ
jgi:2-polyprenyl-6-methoxyphenol hydroxylase-like FAD-dependent oxidoreductase